MSDDSDINRRAKERCIAVYSDCIVTSMLGDKLILKKAVGVFGWDSVLRISRDAVRLLSQAKSELVNE